MKLNTPLLQAAAAAALLACAPAGAAAPTIDWLLPAPDAAESFALGISPTGHLTGFDRLIDGRQVAWLLTPTGTRVGLDGGHSSYAWRANADGVVVGALRPAADAGWQAWRWSPATGLVMLPGDNAVARGINSLGEIVGTANGQAWHWGADGSSQPLPGALPGSTAHAVNATGVVAGAMPNLGTGQFEGMQWTLRNGLLPLETPGIHSEAVGVSEAGDTVGFVTLTETPTPAFWHYFDGRAQLLDRGTARLGEARDVNSAGQIVGHLQGDDGRWFGALWSSRDAAPINLNTLLDAPVQSSFAFGISSSAQIAMTLTLQDGSTRAARVTLHPTWTGGDGAWAEPVGSGWDWSGTGWANVVIGAMHDVRIAPTTHATVLGAPDGAARRLSVVGATFDLASGSTRVTGSASFEAGATLAGAGLLTASDLHLMPGSALQVRAGQTQRIEAGTLRMEGQAGVLGEPGQRARWEVAGHTRIAPQGQLTLRHADMDSALSLLNEGDMTLAHARVTLSPDGLIQRGALTFAEGDVYIEGVLRLEAGSHTSVLEGAKLYVSTLLLGTDVLGMGSMQVGGTFLVGEGPLAARLTPHLMLEAGSLLDMELAGLIPGTGNDHLTMDGSAWLQGGALRLAWSRGHEGRLGDVYDLFDWNGGVQGRFGLLDLPELAPGLVWDSSQLYSIGTLSVAAVPEPSTWALWLAGLAGAGFMARRRGRDGR